ncbi:MAG: DNA polymerase III subunit gamma/tau [Azoarcus sp.]|jgi:DNA polymerase-3 subunit gamma/tau|nr:DNA polymerase III subunit gamma/tau [Azoarcus sp.]
MSYQVLARKWRPKSFETLVGQEHVVRALTHALNTGRLHHAWLFTGTRGVGKTTISRILAKALNCEKGVSAQPCGECETCRAIDADRFPDYVEMDAASNRGVDDMVSLLERAVYAPVAGRYKVYMIDEVHQLTGHAFNAMLKTLEEPPEHVKFILATTDPQKIPVTVLSRCLQFNLKQMPPGRTTEHLTHILESEAIPFEPGALRHIARAGNGSMRDSLSLLDQAIAHGAGQVLEAQVTDMLGTVGEDHLHAILDALAAESADALVAVADGMEARSLSFEAALQALASLLMRIALVQFAPAAIPESEDRDWLLAQAQRFDAEYLQLAYQIAIHSRDELPLAPDEYTGFVMSLLRMLAFKPEQPSASGSAPPTKPSGGTGKAHPLPPSTMLAKQAPAGAVREPPLQGNAGTAGAVKTEANTAVPDAHNSAISAAFAHGDWREVVRMLGITGMVRELAQNCEWADCTENRLNLRLSEAHRHLYDINRNHIPRVESELARALGRPIKLNIEIGSISGQTPAQKDALERIERRAQAISALESHPFVQELIERFDATLNEETVKLL